MSDIGFIRHKGHWNIRLIELILHSTSSDEGIPSPNSIIPMKLHLCSAPVRLYYRCKYNNKINVINHFITQQHKSLSDHITAPVESIVMLIATFCSWWLIFNVSIITQTCAVYPYAGSVNYCSYI